MTDTMKAAAVLVLLAAGCAPPPAPRPLPDLRAQIAVGGMLALMSPSPAPLPPQPPEPEPSPKPKPPASVPCENCNGTGVVGDGRTGMTCPACGGSGVTPAPKVSTAGVSTDWVPYKGPQPTFRIVCEDGVCRRIRIAPPQK